MNFELVKKVDEPVNAYGHKGIKTGDVIELDGRLAEKAKGNEDFKESTKKPTVKPAQTKKTEEDEVA